MQQIMITYAIYAMIGIQFIMDLILIYSIWIMAKKQNAIDRIVDSMLAKKK